MYYKLAKQLRDQGFPGSENWYDTPKAKIMWADDTYSYLAPTLTELIEACGHGFLRLTKHSDGDWRVTGSDTFDHWGKTPEQAVAKLWLALNKK